MPRNARGAFARPCATLSRYLIRPAATCSPSSASACGQSCIRSDTMKPCMRISGRAPERPIFVVKPGARGDLTLKDGATSNESVVWSRSGRGSYMPTPLAYQGLLYVLANNGVFDAYDLKTGTEVYRQRLPYVGSGYSASPVGADGKIYLSSEDGEMLVVTAGREFQVVSTNSMGELLMATPALSEGLMFVRTAESLIAVGHSSP